MTLGRANLQAVPGALSAICHANLDLSNVATQWDRIVHLVASVHSGCR